jgi:circadian clock protein KaiC
MAYLPEMWMTESDPIERLRTGISGFDQVALGGLPAGRSTFVGGTTGSGKTLFAVEFLARGILQFGEPGVFITFEETAKDIRRNYASLGFPIAKWEQAGQWAFVDASHQLDEEAPIVGSYDFGALVARIEHAVRGIGAQRVSLDSLSAVFTRFADGGLIRHEMHRIGRALTRLAVTAVITAERTHEYNGVSNYGIEEFVLDNVIILRNVLAREQRRRTIEIVKFRGAAHRTGEWLFTIDPHDGLVIIPLAFLDYPSVPASQARVSSGIADLDQMCGGGIYKDAIVLLTAPSGAGKTLTALKFIAGGLAAGEPCLSFTFDEGREQLLRSAAGWGIDLRGAEEAGLLSVVCDYPEVASVEDHFLRIRRAIDEHAPGRLVIDTLSALERIASPHALLDIVIAIVAVARQNGITTLLTATPAAGVTPQVRPLIAGELASLTDVAITLSYYEQAGQIQRAIAVIQTRGSAHDPRVRQVTVDGGGMHIMAPIPGMTSLPPGAAILTAPDQPPGSPGSRGPQPDG